MSILNYPKRQNTLLTPNFVRSEFDCKCNGLCNTTIHDEELSKKLQIVRDYFTAKRSKDTPIIITSGYRCPKHNANIGGATSSYHMKGMAADFIISGISVSEICKVCEAVGFNGIGMYDDGYVHVDVRDESQKAFWKNSEQIPVSTFGGKDLDIYINEPVTIPTNAAVLAEAIKKVLKDYGY